MHNEAFYIFYFLSNINDKSIFAHRNFEETEFIYFTDIPYKFFATLVCTMNILIQK